MDTHSFLTASLSNSSACVLPGFTTTCSSEWLPGSCHLPPAGSSSLSLSAGCPTERPRRGGSGGGVPGRESSLLSMSMELLLLVATEVLAVCGPPLECCWMQFCVICDDEDCSESTKSSTKNKLVQVQVMEGRDSYRGKSTEGIQNIFAKLSKYTIKVVQVQGLGKET